MVYGVQLGGRRGGGREVDFVAAAQPPLPELGLRLVFREVFSLLSQELLATQQLCGIGVLCCRVGLDRVNSLGCVGFTPFGCFGKSQVKHPQCLCSRSHCFLKPLHSRAGLLYGDFDDVFFLTTAVAGN